MICFDICQQKKCTGIVIKKMAAMPMLAGVGLMMVCCSSSSAMMMMGGGDESPAAGGAGGAGAGSTVTYVEADTVKLTHNKPIMLAEVMIYDSDDKLISHDGSATITSSATEPNWGGVGRLIPTWTDGSSHLIEYDPKTNAFMTTNTDGTPVKTTKIRLQNFGSDSLILAEIQVFDKAGTNIALTGTAALSTTHHPDWAAANANDGNLTNTAHSRAGAGAGQYLDLDLGGEKEVAKVVVINRIDTATRTQMLKSVVQFYNGDDLVMTTPPIPNGDKAKYEYKVGKHLNRWVMT